MDNLPDLAVAVDQEYRGCWTCLGWEQYKALMGLEDVKVM